MSIKQIESESANDQLKSVRNNIRTGKWTKGENKPYLVVKNELTVIGKLVLRGTRIIMPETLRNTTLKIAHEGHPGIVVMNRLMVAWDGS